MKKTTVRKIFSFQLIAAILIFAVLFQNNGAAQSTGVLVPADTNESDETVLSLAVMNIDVCIENQFATVKVVQIYDNHTSGTLEGKYLFDLPPRASISDFAVWDGETRIPGVMMERRRAEAAYAQIKEPQVDPGLLQQTDEAGGTSAFTAKVFPINAYGTKRIEMEYTEMLPVENLSSHYTFPLKPSNGNLQRVGEFHLRLCIYGDYPIVPKLSNSYPLQITKNTTNEFEARFDAENIVLSDDFSIDYQLDVPENVLSFAAYRAPEKISAYDLRDPAQVARNSDGYFEARAIFAAHKQQNLAPRRVLLLLDASLSMHGEKLERAVEAADYFLHNLNEQDEFNLVLFSHETNAFSETPLAATPERIENALNFIKSASLGGGTNLKKTFERAVQLSQKFSPGERNLVLISDANPTLETADLKKITKVFENTNSEFSIKVSAFALGGDANVSLLKDLTEKTRGAFAEARETEDITLALKIFFAKIGQPTIENLSFKIGDESNLYQVYATSQNSFPASSAAFVGRYKQPKTETIAISGLMGKDVVDLSREAVLPEFADARDYLPRLWARARVDALVQEINRDGEREDYISEIIRLSQKYKFVTPYTAFIAAPRALLRPRLIQPGDPVIRVKTDPTIESVFAVLPFGETLPLKFIETQNVWQTRFLAPAWMPDGTYTCRLLLRDKNGNGYEEQKTFVVDAHAPRIKINSLKQTVRAGDEILLKVAADADTARLTAKFYGAEAIQLSWSNEEKANVGRLRIPHALAAGKYVLTVTAEDFAHNQSTVETNVEVFGN